MMVMDNLDRMMSTFLDKREAYSIEIYYLTSCMIRMYVNMKLISIFTGPFLNCADLDFRKIDGSKEWTI